MKTPKQKFDAWYSKQQKLIKEINKKERKEKQKNKKRLLKTI